MKLLHELRRRQMFRLTGLYIAGAWVVIQVADIAFPSWGIPESAMRFLLYAALLCFPVALVFGWYFDIRADGIYRTRKAGPDEIVETTMRWQDYAILAGLAGIGISILVGSAERIRVETGVAPIEAVAYIERRANSVAVLPFDNLDPNPETGYFSDGVADEILSKLSNMRTLFVVARGSSFPFRDSDESPAMIAAKLGVEYLLSGSVRRDGDMVRVTARLIDENGSHVWSESFDHKLENTLAVQTEIANAVASRIVSKVSTSKGTEPGGTVAPAAYTSYLLGKKLFVERPYRWFEDALPLFRKAIDIDPDFAPPYAYLAIVMSLFGPYADNMAEIEAAVDKARELDPELAAGYVALGLLQRHRDGDSHAYIDSLRKAIDREPTLWIAYNLLGIALLDEGRLAEAHQVHAESLERDPLNPVFIVQVAWQYLSRGEFDRGEELMLRMTQLPQTPSFMYRHILQMYWNLGRWDQYIHWSKQAFRYSVPRLIHSQTPAAIDEVGELGSAYLELGIREQGFRLLELAAQHHPAETGQRHWRNELCRWRDDLECMRRLLTEMARSIDPDDDAEIMAVIEIGLGYVQTQDYDKAVEYLDALFENRNIAETIHNLFGWEVTHRLVFARRMTGDEVRARRLADEAGELLDRRVEVMGSRLAPVLTQVALNHWLRADKGTAIDTFRQALDAGWIDVESARRDPMMRAFFGIGDFRAEFDRIEQEVARQRAVVAAADADDDFDVFVRRFLDSIETSPQTGQ